MALILSGGINYNIPKGYWMDADGTMVAMPYNGASGVAHHILLNASGYSSITITRTGTHADSICAIDKDGTCRVIVETSVSSGAHTYNITGCELLSIMDAASTAGASTYTLS